MALKELPVKFDLEKGYLRVSWLEPPEGLNPKFKQALQALISENFSFSKPFELKRKDFPNNFDSQDLESFFRGIQDTGEN